MILYVMFYHKPDLDFQKFDIFPLILLLPPLPIEKGYKKCHRENILWGKREAIFLGVSEHEVENIENQNSHENVMRKPCSTNYVLHTFC